MLPLVRVVGFNGLNDFAAFVTTTSVVKSTVPGIYSRTIPFNLSCYISGVKNICKGSGAVSLVL